MNYCVVFGLGFFCIAMTIKLANRATYFKMTIISCTVTWGCSAENTNFCTGKVKGYSRFPWSLSDAQTAAWE